MGLETSNISHGFPPKAVIHLLLVIGLMALAYAIVNQQLLIAFAIATMPLTLFVLGYGFMNPRFIYLIYAIYDFSFTVVGRYTLQSQLSAGLEAILSYGFISIILVSYLKKGCIKWNNAINVLTISYIPWILFSLFQLSNPAITGEGIFTGIRFWILRSFFLYVFLSLFSDTAKTLRYALDFLAIIVFLSFLKLLWQKYIGFDSAERYWLYVQGASSTHILGSGTRYFSFFSDAANYGSFMAATGFLYSIIGLHYPLGIKKVCYLAIAAISFYAMFVSGTRGAIAIPFVGGLMYCLLSKNIRTFSITAVTGLLLYSFFAFTTIGNSNTYIRRARTAFSPSEDASMNVRLRNRIEIAEYIDKHPLGTGYAGAIPKLWLQKDGTYLEGTLPPDSFFVRIWIQTGTFGLILYIIICGLVIIGGSIIVLFKIRDPLLQHILSALTCTTLGLWASGYTGYNPGMPPTDFVIPAMMAFVMNGATIDKEIAQKKLLTTKTNNAI